MKHNVYLILQKGQCVFNDNFDIQLVTQSLQGWPKIWFELYSRDNMNRIDFC